MKKSAKIPNLCVNIGGTVNSEIFAGILFSQIALKDIFTMLKFASWACFTYISKLHSDFAILRGFYFHETYAKFRENKNLVKISQITVAFI